MIRNMKDYSHTKIKGWVMQSGKVNAYLKEHFSKEAQILDIGAGQEHFLLSFFEDEFKNLSGTDIQNRLVFSELKNIVDFKVANLNKEPILFEDEKFDVVTAFEVFEHLENPFNFARECQRILKPNGILIFSYPYAWSLQSRIKFLLSGNIIGYRPSNSHITFLTHEIFNKCFIKNANFKITDAFYYRVKIKLFGKEIKLPANKYFGNGVCYIMEKQVADTNY